MKVLPEEFIQRMQKLLGDEYSAFIDTFKMNRFFGLRVNTLKIRPEELQHIAPFKLLPIPWLAEGFYYQEDDAPGKHYYHSAGLYYIQEPSAMAPGAILAAQPGEKILDLCAAPGGKTTQIAAALNNQGVIVANDLSYKRAQVLAMNIERMGIRNSFVTVAKPEDLAEYFPNYFDRILVDAPCSGEGMFRKMPEAIQHWNLEAISKCSIMQRDILEYAVKMLKVGGILVYSTCTFAPEENEGSIEHFLNNHPEFQLEDIKDFEPGRPEWIEHGRNELKKTGRLWPHLLKGEGHFVARLRKTDGQISTHFPYTSKVQIKELKDYAEFCQENLRVDFQGKFTLFGSHLYLTPDEIPAFSGLKVIRPGWYLGEFKKNRFEPSHAFALGLKMDMSTKTMSLTTEMEIKAFLRGETLRKNGKKGWTLLGADGFPLGWGKMVNGILKNHYPRSMRWFF